MKLIHKSYKFKITPDKEQIELLSKHFGACRFVFNRYLNSRKETYLEEKKSLNYYDPSAMPRGWVVHFQIFLNKTHKNFF